MIWLLALMRQATRMSNPSFEWDARKDAENQSKHVVPFTHRSGVVRIIGAGYWRKGKVVYERESQIHE